MTFPHLAFCGSLSLRSFGLTQKNQKVKTQQSSHRTRPNAGPLLRQPPRPSKLSLVLKKVIKYQMQKQCCDIRKNSVGSFLNINYSS